MVGPLPRGDATGTWGSGHDLVGIVPFLRSTSAAMVLVPGHLLPCALPHMERGMDALPWGIASYKGIFSS